MVLHKNLTWLFFRNRFPDSGRLRKTWPIRAACILMDLPFGQCLSNKACTLCWTRILGIGKSGCKDPHQSIQQMVKMNIVAVFLIATCSAKLETFGHLEGKVTSEGEKGVTSQGITHQWRWHQCRGDTSMEQVTSVGRWQVSGVVWHISGGEGTFP